MSEHQSKPNPITHHPPSFEEIRDNAAADNQHQLNRRKRSRGSVNHGNLRKEKRTNACSANADDHDNENTTMVGINRTRTPRITKPRSARECSTRLRRSARLSQKSPQTIDKSPPPAPGAQASIHKRTKKQTQDTQTHIPAPASSIQGEDHPLIEVHNVTDAATQLPADTDETAVTGSSPSPLLPAPDTPVNLLDALISLPDLDSYTRGSLAVAEALRLNMEMQQHAENQIRWITDRIQTTRELMQNVRDLSTVETFMQGKAVKIYKKYKDTYDLFVDKDGNKPPSTIDPAQEDTIDQSMSIVRRTWSNAERQRLLDGVHAEARRAMVISLVASKEEHKIWDVDKMEDKDLENVSVDKLNWARISSIYVQTRTPMQCIIQWTTQEHPSINKKPWSKSESERLAALVKKHGLYGQWELIAKEHGSNRTASQCFSRYQSERNNLHAKKKWTEDDNESLREAVMLLGERNWQQVASMLGNRTGNQCLQRWMKSINPAIRRGKWTKQEDETLKHAVTVYGAGNWKNIQRHLPGRTDMQARERWTNILDPAISFAPFTKEDLDRLSALVQEHGRKWSLLTQFFPGRTDNQLLRMWKTTEGKKAKKASKAASQS